jgi:hypothetical protein
LVMKISHLNMDAESICSGEKPFFLSFIHSALMFNKLTGRHAETSVSLNPDHHPNAYARLKADKNTFK